MGSDGQEQLFIALARLVNAGAAALDSYTKMKEKQAEYFANANSQAQVPTEAAFEEYQPGFFEKRYREASGPRQS
jgi:hypothetical protein